MKDFLAEWQDHEEQEAHISRPVIIIPTLPQWMESYGLKGDPKNEKGFSFSEGLNLSQRFGKLKTFHD